MDIDRIVNDIKNEYREEAQPDIMTYPLQDLKILLSQLDLKNIDIRAKILDRWRADLLVFIDNYLLTCPDPHASEGMYKCSLETWKACANRIGLDYFLKYKLVRDYKREAREGGLRLNGDLIDIGLVLYEGFCNEFRKQFFVYDACKFLGISLDYMYTLNDMHARYMKKAHSIQEDSMRSALASGRSNVTAMAILLNHDYDYTRTTQVIHTSQNNAKLADSLPTLEDRKQDRPQDIVLVEDQQQQPKLLDSL